jgi:hypothetical protein
MRKVMATIRLWPAKIPKTFSELFSILSLIARQTKPATKYKIFFISGFPAKNSGLKSVRAKNATQTKCPAEAKIFAVNSKPLKVPSANLNNMLHALYNDCEPAMQPITKKKHVRMNPQVCLLNFFSGASCGIQGG